MQLEETGFTGRREEHYWVAIPQEIRTRANIVSEFFPNKRCHITSFDSGPIFPSANESVTGWRSTNGIMVSPPISKNLDIPYDQYDEWYILETADFPIQDPEVFVNYGGFTLLDVRTLRQNDDPTWDHKRWDFLEPIQERFWWQMKQIDPIAFIASGDIDIAVSRNEEFIDAMRNAA